jgi:hypothetical protein
MREDKNGGKVLPFRQPEREEVIYEVENPYFCFSATLRIFGQNLDLDAITERLGVHPSHVHRKGERRGPRSPEYKHDMWSLKAPLPEETALEDHLEWLHHALAPQFTYLKELKQAAQVDIFCGYRSNSATAGFEVDYRALQLFFDLEVPFSVSVIVIEDDDEVQLHTIRCPNSSD